MSARRAVSPAIFPVPDEGLRTGPVPPLVESYRRLAEIFHDVLSEQNLDDLLGRVADTLAELVPYDALHLYEADVPARQLVPRLARTEWAEEVMRTRPVFGEGITGWAVANRQPVLTNQAHLDPRVVTVPGTPVDPEALISIPLIARGSLKGALNIYRIGEDAEFTGADFELAKWFGDAAALALDNVQVRATLEHQAQTDSLTGLYNHRFFHERLRAELTRAARSHDSIGLLMFDIDDFKRVNDICGHAVGDQILGAIANALTSLVRASDVPCRIGGEEFAVIMPSCGAGDALGLARRLMDRIREQPIDAAGEITFSIGVAEGPEHATNPRELVACAEAAMMTGKARGKNRIVVFSEGVAERPEAADPTRDARSIAHLKMLQSVAARLNRFNTVREIGEAIVNELRMLVDYHSCRVYLAEGDVLVPIAVRGDVESEQETLSELRVPFGFGITGRVGETGRSVLLSNSQDCDFGEMVPGTEPVDESIVAVPLRYDARVNGVVFLSQLGVDRFDENDVRLLEVLAGYAAVALENARLYESLRREAEHAKAWLEFADEVSAAGSVERMGETVVETVARLLEVEQCSLWLEDPALGGYVCAASHGYLDDATGAIIAETHITEEAAEQFIQSRKTPFLMTAEQLHDWFFTDMDVDGLRPVATAPLPTGHGVQGWITVRAPQIIGLDHFTDDRLRLLDGLAYRASMAIQKALLYRVQRENAHVANALLEFGRELVPAASEADALACACELVARMLRMPRAYVLLDDAEGGDVRIGASFGTDGSTGDLRFPSRLMRELAARGDEAFVLGHEQVMDVLAKAGIDITRTPSPLAIAPLALSGERLGFLIAASDSDEHEFADLDLRLLAGMAHQAALLITR
ncbi:MAG TPA: diguanylate cyclase [Gaiellaceae bacterium]|nr:diguanylate cyclase [Gaiellaceae bacterium]